MSPAAARAIAATHSALWSRLASNRDFFREAQVVASGEQQPPSRAGRTGSPTRMRFVSVRELRGRSADVWKTLAAEKELVVTSNGRPIALLSETSEDRLEESLQALRRARAELAAASMQRASLAAGTDRLTLDEINSEIAAVREARARSVRRTMT